VGSRGWRSRASSPGVEEADVLAAKDLVHAHRQLSARDALHAAVMRRREITEILSFDRRFDAVAGITRLPTHA
jgi:predicted nucleic acid-binding protein